MRPLLFFMLLAMSMAFADTNYYQMVGAAGMVATFIVGIAYMASQVMQNQQLETWAKSEWRELIIAGITVGIVYSAVILSHNQILGITTGYANNSSLINEVEARYNASISNLTVDYKDTVKAAHRLGMISSYFYTKGGGYIFYFGINSAPYAGMNGLMQSINTLGANLQNAIAIYHVMTMFLKFFFYVSVQYILPIGLALRLIPFTRAIGGSLLALALAGVFVYPFSMALASELHNSVDVPHSTLSSSGDIDDLKLDLPSFLVGLCSDDYIRIFTSLSEWGWWVIICPTYCLVVSLTNVLLPCLSQCAVCAAACYSLFYSYFTSCVIPFGLCWQAVSYPFYNLVQAGFMTSSSIAMVASSASIEDSFGGDYGEIYDVVTSELVIPANTAASMAMMEAVLVGGLTIIGSRALASVIGGEVNIVGLERLI